MKLLGVCCAKLGSLGLIECLVIYSGLSVDWGWLAEESSSVKGDLALEVGF